MATIILQKMKDAGNDVSASNVTFIIRNVKDLTINTDFGYIATPVPEGQESSSNVLAAILMKAAGSLMRLTVQWIMKEEDPSVSGYATVKTVDAQYEYLHGFNVEAIKFAPQSMLDSYQLQLGTLSPIKCVIASINLQRNMGEVTYNATMEVYIGKPVVDF